MTVAVPCQRCGRSFQAGHGALCPNCRGGYAPGERRIPDIRGQRTVPLNNAARRAQGLPEDPNEPKGGEAYMDYTFNQAVIAMTGETDPAKQDAALMRKLFP
jgi:hypothetical protein